MFSDGAPGSLGSWVRVWKSACTARRLARILRGRWPAPL